ncbi:MAG: LysR family transcriptional regulator [bacterium]
MIDTSDVASLITLDALLQEGSVTLAAKRLGLSTPAVSHALARLRDRLDDPLLVRAGRTMVLTPRAELLKEPVRDAVALATRVFERVEAFDPARLQRSFTLSLTDYVLFVLGDTLEGNLRGAAPNLDMRYIPNAPDDPERLRRGDTDLAVGIYGDLPPELKMRPLVTDRLVCVVRQGHPELKRRLTLNKFCALEHVQVAPRGKPGGYVDDVLMQRGLTRRVARAIPYFQIALRLVSTSDYILTVSERIARGVASDLNLQVFEPPLELQPFTLSMVWHPRFDGDAAHAWLRDQLVQAAATLPDNAHGNARRSESKPKQ